MRVVYYTRDRRAAAVFTWLRPSTHDQARFPVLVRNRSVSPGTYEHSTLASVTNSFRPMVAPKSQGGLTLAHPKRTGSQMVTSPILRYYWLTWAGYARGLRRNEQQEPVLPSSSSLPATSYFQNRLFSASVYLVPHLVGTPHRSTEPPRGGRIRPVAIA